MPAITREDICNDALSRAGSNVYVDDVDAEATEEARACQLHYPRARDLLLVQAPWPFAIKNQVLAAVDGVTRTPYSYGFTLPGDFLRDIEILIGLRAPRSDQRVKYVIEKGIKADGTFSDVLMLFANYVAPQLRYIAKVENAGSFMVEFSDALAALLAVRLARALRADVNRMRLLEADAKMSLAQAVAAIAGYGEPELEPESTFTSGWFNPTSSDPWSDW